MATVWAILMLIDGAIYNLICYVYEIFYYLATLNIFTEEHYQGIVNRIYVVLGLFMLFVLAYSLLKAIINPDNFAKNEQSFPNLIKNVIISLVIIVLLPTVFSAAFNIQNAVLNNDTIPKLILGLDGGTDDNSGGGRTIAYYLFKAFLYPNSDYCVSEGYDDIEACRDSIKGNGWLFVTNGDQLTVMDDAVLNGSSFTNYNDYSESVRDGKLSYLFPISTVAGIFTLYVLLNFCFDMAIRVVKLAFYQIIAPIPVICRVMPGGSMKDVFNKWVKQIISIFLEVFIRIAVLAICIYLINIVVDTYNSGLPNIDSLGFTQRPIVLALIIMGIVIFMKQAPQILGDLLGLKTDSMKLGLMDKLAMGGGLIAGAAVGGGASMFAKNAVAAGKNFHATKGQGFKARAGAFAGGAASVVAGTVSGATRSGFGARSAKNFKDMKGATSKGISDATDARLNRAKYKAYHGGTIRGSVAGHVSDNLAYAKEWLGVNDSLESFNAEREFYGKITAIDDNSDSVAADLLSRDAVSQSAALMAEAGGPNMSLDAMRERMESARKENAQSMIGRTVTDFSGSTRTISNENDYAVYLASLKSQVSKSERDMKKYLKKQGYKGDSGVSEISSILNTEGLGLKFGSGELQRMAKLKSDRDNIQSLVAENSAMISQLNSRSSTSVKVDSISDASVSQLDVNGNQVVLDGAWEQMDQLVNNVKSRNIEINADIERMTRERERRGGGQSNNNK